MSKQLLVGMAALALCAGAAAQKSAADGIAEYRKMLEDGNPADLFEAKGEDLWKTKRGPKNASLEACDLGQGPGVVKGAFVTLPRYFADTGRVQDLESRLVTCMATLQGFDAAEIAKTPFGRGEMANVTALATYVAAMSRGLRFNLPQSNAQERTSYEIGKRAFFYRARLARFLLRVLPRRRRQAHPPAGPAQPDQEPRRRHRLRGLAGLPRVQRSDVEHAAAAERLLPAAALSLPRLRLGSDDRAGHLHGCQRQGCGVDRTVHQALRTNA